MKLNQQIVPNLHKYLNRSFSSLERIIIHRSGPWPKEYGEHKDAQDVANTFANNNLGTGYKMPYSYVLNPDNLSVFRAVPLEKVTPHAGRYNITSVGIAILKDLRNEHIDDEAFVLLAELCNHIRMFTNKDLEIVGHTDLPGASKDLDKVCPGKNLDIHELKIVCKLLQNF
jgi:hypothetical protein